MSFPVRVVGLAELGVVDLATWATQAEPIVGQVFGGHRPAGWLARKLAREAARTEWSSVAIDVSEIQSVEPSDWGRVLGFMWLGAPKSLPGTARAVGMGVVPLARGRGIARALVQRSIEVAQRHDVSRVRCLVEPKLEPFYAQFGFEPVARRRTLLARASGQRVVPGPSLRPWTDVGQRPVSFEWLQEAWDGTPAHERHTLDLSSGSARAWVSRESGGWLVQRFAIAGPSRGRIAASLQELRQRLPAPDPVFLYGTDEPYGDAHGLTGSSVGADWSVAQRFAVMERFTSGPTP